jgi:hypothetical protein
MAERLPRYPMPVVMRDLVEVEMSAVADRDLVSVVRRLIALAYAHGFEDGALNATVQAHHDRAAPQPEEAPR